MINNTPRERRHARTRQAILDATRGIISKQGVEGLSMRSLAKKIDYSPSALYKYFDSKDEIIGAIRDEGFERLAAHMTASIEDGLTTREKLISVGMAYLEFAEQNPEHYPVMFNITQSSLTIEHISDFPMFRLLAEVIEEGIASGGFKPADGYTPMAIIYHGWVAVHGIAMLRLSLLRAIRSEFDGMSRRIVESTIDSFSVK
jgi:AcrR family transcriptional regulator